MPKPWFVYILRCADGSYYTGITTDPPRRLAQHNAGRGCAFAARRLPARLAYCEAHAYKSSARRREVELKPLSRANKERLIRSQQHGFPSEGPRA